MQNFFWEIFSLISSGDDHKNEKSLLFWSEPITARYTTANHFFTSLNLNLA
jgi:hypothetical protein